MPGTILGARPSWPLLGIVGDEATVVQSNRDRDHSRLTPIDVWTEDRPEMVTVEVVPIHATVERVSDVELARWPDREHVAPIAFHSAPSWPSGESRWRRP